MQELQSVVYNKRNEMMALLASFSDDRKVMRITGEFQERLAVGEQSMRNLQDMVLRKKKAFADDTSTFLFEISCIEADELVRRAAVTVSCEDIKHSMKDFRLDLYRLLESHLIHQDLSKIRVDLIREHIQRMYSRLEKDPTSLEIDPGFSEEFLDLGDLSTEPYGGWE